MLGDTKRMRCDLAKALAAVERQNLAGRATRRPRSSAARKRLRRERRAGGVA